MYSRIHAYMYVHDYVCTAIHVYKHTIMYVHTYIHTYILYTQCQILLVLFSLPMHEACRPRDFVAVLDSSDSISNPDYRLLKEFVANLFNDPLFLIERGKYHTGMIAYGYGIEVVYNLRQIYEKDRVVQTVRDLERLDAFRGTRTTKALTKAYNMFQSRGRPIKTAPHTMLVITDGKATDDKGGSLDRILADIRAADIEVFCITINIDEDNREEIERIADDRAHILRLPDFEGLDEFAGLAAENFCQKPDKPVCVPACVHGTCGPEGTCVCDAGWTGLDCGWPGKLVHIRIDQNSCRVKQGNLG